MMGTSDRNSRNGCRDRRRGRCGRPDAGGHSSTRRDVKHIPVSTAHRVDPRRGEWITNTAGEQYSTWYSFGALDAETAAVIAAKEWVTVPVPYTHNTGLFGLFLLCSKGVLLDPVCSLVPTFWLSARRRDMSAQALCSSLSPPQERQQAHWQLHRFQSRTLKYKMQPLIPTGDELAG